MGLLPGDDLLNDLRGDGLDIGAIGHLRVGHNGGGVAVHQDHGIALFFEGFARLGARVVKLTCLPDHDGSCAHNQDLLNIGPLGHTAASFYHTATSIEGGSHTVLTYGRAMSPGPCRTGLRCGACARSASLNHSNRYPESCGPGEASG